MAVKAGTEDKKKVYALGGLLAVAGVVYYMNSGNPSDHYTPPAAASRPPSVSPAQPGGPQASAAGRNTRSNQRLLREFRPSLKPKRPEDRPDPTTIDPTLRLELLAKVQAVRVEGAHRNIFEFGAAPPPASESAKTAGTKTKVPSPLLPPPTAQSETAGGPPPKPTAPPVPMKFYGYVTPVREGKRAFFMEGEDIHVVTEGDIVKKRYKIVRIGVNSVVVEDTQFGSQQTLPLEEQPG